MVGSAMALDLSTKFKVTVADLSSSNLQKIKSKASVITTIELDVTEEANLKATISDFDMVVCAVPGFLGFNTLKNIIEAGKDVVDISFFPENALELNDLAIEHNVTAIVDCGVAPGMDNIILGYHNETMKIDTFECLVGGLPKVKKWPFCYKAPFSPVDVIEEYTRPARYVENFKLIEREALTDAELLEFEGVGTLESFNTDGLRSIIHTMSHIPNMKEKTLRYPGHIDYIRALKTSGFFEDSTVTLQSGAKVSPLEFTSQILFDEWKLGENEEELTIMKVTIKGTNESGQEETIVYHLLDHYNPETQISSMARTTGYTATAAVNIVEQGLFNEKGVFPPELVGKHSACFEYFMQYLLDRGIVYRKETILN